ncbi:MAG: glycerol-3-phosphate dehydrogenase/oxidase [Verrucomicrobia bacterium]|nr:glycerol-3-phosphate dehydrogenase/oxidase [Verrucomicrobiota bacterium]
MNRDHQLQQLQTSGADWDVLVIGGGAAGLGTALDAASRGYRTALIERGDFSGGTSSRSTKLIHGGVRYLRQGRIKLVQQALRERGVLQRNAPSIIQPIPFIIPVRSWHSKMFYSLGLKLYEKLSGRLGLGSVNVLSPDQVGRELPGADMQGVTGGVRYWDAQFDDARLALRLADATVRKGGTVMNYCEAGSFLKSKGRVLGVMARDLESGKEFEVIARVVISATGVWTDELRQQPGVPRRESIKISQGSHLVLPADFLGGSTALMVPRTSDGRVLFVIPWLGCCLVGTTDVAVGRPLRDPSPMDSERAFLMDEASRHLSRPVRETDILSEFSGLRPLITAGEGVSTASISREHRIERGVEGVVWVFGGKWTTYRAMGEEAVDLAARVGGLRSCTSVTRDVSLDASAARPDDDPAGRGTSLHAGLGLYERDVRWSVQNEMARTVEDMLARRTRALFRDARAAAGVARATAEIMSGCLGRSKDWVEQQTADFRALAAHHLPPGSRDLGS